MADPNPDAAAAAMNELEQKIEQVGAKIETVKTEAHEIETRLLAARMAWLAIRHHLGEPNVWNEWKNSIAILEAALLGEA